MKKLLAVLMICAVLMPCLALADRTERRGLSEFLEVYMYRLTEYAAKNKLDVKLNFYSTLTPWVKGDYTVFESSAGSIAVYISDFTIHDILMNFGKVSGSVSATGYDAVNCMMAISALEFGVDDETTPFMKMYVEKESSKIFTDVILKKLPTAIRTAQETGNRVFLCSYNYDYYVACNKTSAGTYVYLIAEAR